ncbi:AAA family ATPase [Thermomonas carbonis]|uniref:AAA family ATPase n=1 Tax=Thermomonas carbonis TaxID=1463158 RepID=A0A7G9SLN6_9GAMM|nr:AAA family ATPase [Thermomonas carbonis]QNN68761.1 AAA family ATPase [Thermomonas carbonis]GHC08950.1 hypothetical protein GCM10010080_25040 [Thermomonas carbonis]
MDAVTLTAAERLLLTRVLDLRLSLSRKSTPMLQPLSFYSSELKGTKQIAGTLDAVATTGKLADDKTSRDRYFNSLSNQGLVDGSSLSPKLTPLADFYLSAWNTDKSDTFWRGAGGNAVELNVIRALVDQMRSGNLVSDVFKLVWFNAQTFFDNVPPPALAEVLPYPMRLLALFRINSHGWEIARYFRLSADERAQFDEAFAKVRPSDQWTPSKQIETAAAQYKDAARTIQADVRFRISGFLNAFDQLRTDLGADLPRLDRQLVLRSSTSAGAGAKKLGSNGGVSLGTGSLPHPHQLIVTGCPGSGKSYYVDQLIQSTGCTVFRTQFHPESSFFDFVGAYKPQPVYEAVDPAHQLEEGDGKRFGRGRPIIDYRFVPGPLTSGLAHALANPNENVVVLIEEINRGNAAAIFGDTLQLLDRDETGASRYGVTASPDIRSYFAGIGQPLETIRLPGNLYLWATMNSADQGVFPLDTAFRRRWNYVYKGYTEPCLYPEELARIRYADQVYPWDVFRRALNDKLVELGIHEDKLIGPYFLTSDQLRNPESILEKLFLYLWDDVLRFRQDSLFTKKSFSLVGALWTNGAGSPLQLTLSSPIAEPVVAEPGEEPFDSQSPSAGQVAQA